jgi:hypothetical protein
MTSTCIPAVFEFDMPNRAIDCLLTQWEAPRLPHCDNHGCGDCCDRPPAPEGWKDCPDGFEPDWEARWCMLAEAYPVLFCTTPATIERLWNEAICIVGYNPCMCEATRKGMIEALLLHFFTIEVHLAQAHQAAMMAGGMKGFIKPVLPAVNSQGGSVRMSDAFYGLTVWGAKYLGLRDSLRRNITGAYFGKARRGTGIYA